MESKTGKGCMKRGGVRRRRKKKKNRWRWMLVKGKRVELHRRGGKR